MRRWVDHLTRLSRGASLLLLSAVAISVRVAWAIVMLGREPRFDEAAYLGHAARLCAGAGYVNDAGVADNFWPVGFPGVLAALSCIFGHDQLTGGVLQVVVGVLTCVLIFLLGERVFGAAVGRAGGLALACYPTHVLYATLLLAEPLSTLLLVAASTVLLWNLTAGAVAAVAAGVLLGLAILTRPVFLGLPAILLFWYAVNGTGVRRAVWLGGLVICTALVVLGPWLVRNHRVLGTWTEVSSTGGYNFLLGNNQAALGGYLSDRDLQRQLVDGDRIEGSRGYRLGWDAIRQAPGAAVRRAAQKVSYFFALETDGVLWNLKGLPGGVPLALALVLLAVANTAYLLVSSGCLLALTIAPRNPFATFFLLVTGYLVLISVIFVGDPRYHYPLIPFVCLLSAKGWLIDAPQLRAAIRAGNPRAQRHVKRWMALNLIFVALMAWNLWLKHLESLRFGENVRTFVSAEFSLQSADDPATSIIPRSGPSNDDHH